MRRRMLAGIVACSALAGPAAIAAVPARAASWHAGPARFGVSAPEQAFVTMSDGTQLAADVYVPTDRATGAKVRGHFPVILAQTPYGKRSALTTRASGSSATGGDGYYPYLVQRGYVNAVVDVRGTGSSQGRFELFGPREVRDGPELVSWASRLPASDGDVGGAGESYAGINQLLTAAAVGPHSPLKAIFPVTAGNDLYRDISFMGGISNAEFAVVFAALRVGMIAGLPDDPAHDPAQTVSNPVSRTQDYAALDGDLYTEINAGGPRAYDSSFWQQRKPANVLGRVVANGIPAFLLNGWNDVYQRGAPLNYAALQNAWAGRPIGAPMRPGQPVTPRYQLAMGPYFHNAAAAGVRLQELQLEWFDTWLKGDRTPLATTRQPLHLFNLGQNHWYDASQYPLSGTRARTLYLAAGSMEDRAPTVPAAADTLAWTAESSPCNRGVDQWTTGLGAYASALGGAPAPPCDQDERTTAAGALTYETAPLRAPLTLAGPIAATLYVSSSTTDSELVASVQDVAPDGSAFPLSTGALLGSLRAVDARRSWTVDGRTLLPYHPYTAASRRALVPGRVEPQRIEIYPTFATLAPGHRLRLTITSGTTALQPSPAQLPGLAGGVYEFERHAGAASRLEIPIASPADLRLSPTSYGPCNGGCHP